MNAVGRLGSYISRGVYSVSTPFHPFGGAVDIIVVEQPDGSFKSSPWYVRFGKFQGVMKTKEKEVNICVNGVEMDFHMYLGNDGQAWFLNEVDVEEGDNQSSPPSSGEDTDGQSNCRQPMKSKSCSFESFDGVESVSAAKADVGDGSVVVRKNSRRSGILGYVFGKRSIKERDTSIVRVDSLERAEIAADLLEVKWSTNLRSPRRQVLKISSQDVSNKSNAKQNLPIDDKVDCTTDYLDSGKENGSVDHENGSEKQRKVVEETGIYLSSSVSECVTAGDIIGDKNSVINSNRIMDGLVTETHSQQIYLHPLDSSSEEIEPHSSSTVSSSNTSNSEALVEKIIIEHKSSELLHPCEPDGGSVSHSTSTSEILEVEQLIFGELDDLNSSNIKHTVLAASDSKEKEVIESFIPSNGFISSSDKYVQGNPPFVADRIKLKSVASDVCISATSRAQPDEVPRLAKSLPIMWSHDSIVPGGQNDQHPTKISQGCEDDTNLSQHSLNDDRNTEAKTPLKVSSDSMEEDVCKAKVTKKKVRALTPTSEQLASLNLKEGKNVVIFTFSTPMLGKQQVDAQIYLWKWDTRIVISDVDGTITRSDVLGQFMPLVGVDWSQTGVAHLFSAIKENGFQLLFLSARAISQAYVTRQFLINLMQDGKGLPEGPVIISPDGLFPSLYREVVRRVPHEFKIACLEDIKALFPVDRNPFYAGFGNRNSDEISYLKVGIPKGKIFIINPKGEIIVNRHITNTKSYTSLRALVNGMFPVLSSSEQEDFNSWNFWKLPPPALHGR
ncbi:PREDICTED: phosphatidate phosphatase PAH2-like isoform X2 [Ipomoea nil]|uniref:phosphatidate phosphatase PAH2-like isoform X2 n=1 Tax=Ipomoea nil TaxID=35883 RepID=UPI0009019AEF|nr:PREDICTED: phosphatidate phosphatase PAH2-like isoform X2 [Ipomoea nil]